MIPAHRGVGGRWEAGRHGVRRGARRPDPRGSGRPAGSDGSASTPTGSRATPRCGAGSTSAWATPAASPRR